MSTTSLALPARDVVAERLDALVLPQSASVRQTEDPVREGYEFLLRDYERQNQKQPFRTALLAFAPEGERANLASALDLLEQHRSGKSISGKNLNEALTTVAIAALDMEEARAQKTDDNLLYQWNQLKRIAGELKGNGYQLRASFGVLYSTDTHNNGGELFLCKLSSACAANPGAQSAAEYLRKHHNVELHADPKLAHAGTTIEIPAFTLHSRYEEKTGSVRIQLLANMFEISQSFAEMVLDRTLSAEKREEILHNAGNQLEEYYRANERDMDQVLRMIPSLPRSRDLTYSLAPGRMPDSAAQAVKDLFSLTSEIHLGGLGKGEGPTIYDAAEGELPERQPLVITAQKLRLTGFRPIHVRGQLWSIEMLVDSDRLTLTEERRLRLHERDGKIQFKLPHGAEATVSGSLLNGKALLSVAVPWQSSESKTAESRPVPLDLTAVGLGDLTGLVISDPQPLRAAHEGIRFYSIPEDYDLLVKQAATLAPTVRMWERFFGFSPNRALRDVIVTPGESPGGYFFPGSNGTLALTEGTLAKSADAPNLVSLIAGHEYGYAMFALLRRELGGARIEKVFDTFKSNRTFLARLNESAVF